MVSYKDDILQFGSLGSKDQTVIIWSIDDYSAKLAKKVELGRPVCYLMWSPNDKMLLITGTFIV